MQKNFGELTVDDLYGALVCYNSDPFLVENEEQAQELLDFLQQDGCICEEVEDWEVFKTAKKRLDLRSGTWVKAIYYCGCWNQSRATICFASDWRIE